MAGGKDKDLMADGCGVTKHREISEHKRPPRMQERKNQRERFLNKEEKKDMLNDIKKQSNQMQETTKTVSSFKDLVEVPQYVQDMSSLTKDTNIQLEESLNDIGGGFDVEVNQYKTKAPVDFDLTDINIEEEHKNADVSNDDIILSEEEQETDPFAQLMPTLDEEAQKEEETEETTEEETTEETEEEQQGATEQEENTQQEDVNDSIDQYLNMEIDDSKLSEQNKEKLDAFTSEQLDAFKKFLYQKKNQDK